MKELHLDEVSVSFGTLKALKKVSVKAKGGEVHLLAGPNGSGKSTLIRVLLGLVKPSAGGLLLDGKRRRVDNAFKSKLGYLPEAVAFSENLTGRQVLSFFARARSVKAARARNVLERVGLKQAAGRAVRGYSRGMRQRLGLAVAILAEPDILVLDEPTGGLDQEGLTVLWDVFDEWREKGKCILMASHDLALMERRVDQVSLLRAGTLLANDSPAGLREKAQVPVIVHFTASNDEGATAFKEAIAEWGKGKVTSPGGALLEVEAAPHNLLGLLDLRTSSPSMIESIRVEEAGLDAVYDRLLEEAAE